VAAKKSPSGDALARFARACLHADFRLEHATPAAAVSAQFSRLPAREAAAVANAARDWLDQHAGSSPVELADAWTRDHGDGWQPASIATLRRALKPLLEHRPSS
jgi:hypothetical protein